MCLRTGSARHGGGAGWPWGPREREREKVQQKWVGRRLSLPPLSPSSPRVNSLAGTADWLTQFVEPGSRRFFIP